MKWLKLALVISVIVSVGVFLYATDFNEVFDILQKIGWKATWILLSTFVAYILGTLGWKYCLGAHTHQITLSRLFVYRHIGETLALFNPTSIIAGDWLKAEALKKHDIPKEEALNSVLLSRILMVVSQMALLITALIWLIFSTHIVLFPNFKIWMSGLLILLVILLLGLTYILLRKPNETAKSNKHKAISLIKKYQIALYNYIQLYPQYSALAFLFLALHWVVGSLEMYFILKILSYDVGIIHGLLMDMGVILVKSVGAFIPGQLGIEEIGNKLVIMMVGISSASLWVSVSILRRSRQLFWSAIGGFLYFFNRKKLL
jgi:uncharacterized protein (TIRG00374 family)